MLCKFFNLLKHLIVSICLCLALCSCSEFDASSPEDYIGPDFAKATPGRPVKAEPNAAAVTPAKPQAPPAIQPSAQDNTLKITVTEATLIALGNNKSLIVQRFNPQINRTLEQEQLSVFDPDITASISKSSTKSETAPRPGLGSFPSRTKNLSADVGISQFFPTGTMVSLLGSTDELTGSYLNEPFVTTRIGAGVTQSLLRGFGTNVNLASVEQAKIDTKASQYELRGFVENLVAQIEETYWDYALAQRQIDIVKQSIEIAQKQLDETTERIKLGDLAQSERVAAEAELALRKGNLINAQSTLAKTKLNLLQLVNPPGANLWDREIVLENAPVDPTEQLDDIEMHVALAMQMRPELNQAKLQWQRDELEIVKTRNGLLPQLDLFITLGRTGYADSFGQSVKNISHTNNYDVIGGVTFEYPPLNRGAEARNLRAVITRDQALEAINNLSQTVEVDIRNAHLEIVRTQEQVAATAATRKLQEEKLKTEIEKFKLGKSTSLLVAQTQRDFLVSQIAEVQAVVDHIKAFVEFYRLEGTLLQRRGIASPGRESVRLPDITVR
jgi:outer membrane protein TolC